MRFYFYILFTFLIANVYTQINFGDKLSHTLLAAINTGDSVVYYQCRAKTGEVTVKTENQTLTSSGQTVSLTEKFTIVKQENAYLLKYFVSGLTIFPNRKFSGLKIREKAYWQFTFNKERVLLENELLFLATLEVKSKETTEYDFAVTKYTTNQLIIKKGKNYEQLLPKETISISEVLKL